jgi:type IV fimbrial biogenesis protein FimT
VLEQLMLPRDRGFTMIELMTVMVVVAILAVLAIPAFGDQLARRRLEGVATDITADLQYARSEAVARNRNVQVVTGGGGSCYVISVPATGGSCDCTTAVPSCTAPSVGLKTVTLPAGITVTNGVTVTYDQLRGTAPVSLLALASTQTAATMQVDVNAMGRVSVCSPSGSLKGYAAC